jgi:prepilin peptidase CpaA
MIEPIVMVSLVVVLVSAMCTDIRSSRIPNWITLTAMGFALFLHAWFDGVPGALFSLGGLVTGLGLFLFFYLSGGIGAGDVKLMAAVGAMVGPYGALMSSLLAILVGGVYALGAMIYEWGILTTGQKLAFTVKTALLPGDKASQNLALPFRLRYGAAIVGGTILFMLGLHPFRG